MRQANKGGESSDYCLPAGAVPVVADPGGLRKSEFKLCAGDLQIPPVIVGVSREFFHFEGKGQLHQGGAFEDHSDAASERGRPLGRPVGHLGTIQVGVHHPNPAPVLFERAFEVNGQTGRPGVVWEEELPDGDESLRMLTIRRRRGKGVRSHAHLLANKAVEEPVDLPFGSVSGCGIHV